jgi:hypothetical protein
MNLQQKHTTDQAVHEANINAAKEIHRLHSNPIYRNTLHLHKKIHTRTMSKCSYNEAAKRLRRRNPEHHQLVFEVLAWNDSVELYVMLIWATKG